MKQAPQYSTISAVARACGKVGCPYKRETLSDKLRRLGIPLEYNNSEINAISPKRFEEDLDDRKAMRTTTVPCLPYLPIGTKYLVGKKGKCITIYQSHKDKLWRDIDGTIYGFADGKSLDDVTRCGIGALSMPTNSPCTLAAVAHDFSYSSPTYQVCNTRYEADQELKRQLKLLGRWYAYPFYLISRFFGGWFWENKKTRDKL